MTATLTRRPHDRTPDSHDFPTRPYDLVKEFVIALVAVTALTVVLAAVFSSPDRKAVTLAAWAKADPADVAATAAGELAGTTTSATYGGPYNSASTGQQLGPLKLQKWAGVRIPVDSANDLVVAPLRSVATRDIALTAALGRWQAAPADTRLSWATAYADALAKAPGGDPAKVTPGSYGPVPVMVERYVAIARSGALEGLLTTHSTFYGSDATRPLLLLADGAYLEDQARADHLGGDQWGMMNESGNYPGQPWMWLYTFWYQVKPFSTSGNADALVWGLMVVLTLALIALPWIPGLRSVPKALGLYRLVWRDAYKRR